MSKLMVRLRLLLRAAYVADREGRACHRRLERTPATRGRTSRRILERRSI